MQGSGTAARSLVQRWIEAVLRDAFAIVSWPIKSASLDELYAIFKAREARNAAKLTYTLTVGDGGVVQALTAASAGGEASAPLMVGDAAAAGGAATRFAPVPAGGSAAFDVGGLSWPRPAAMSG